MQFLQGLATKCTILSFHPMRMFMVYFSGSGMRCTFE